MNLTLTLVGAGMLVVLFCCAPLRALAASIIWNGAGSDHNWSTAGNWAGGMVPTATDTAIFNGTGKKDAIVDRASTFSGSILSLQMTSANTGTILLNRNLIINGPLYLSGGTLDMRGTGSTLIVDGSWFNGGGTFQSGTGTVLLNGTGSTSILKDTSPFHILSVGNGLMGYWKLDETSGIIAADSSGNGNDGTLSHPPLYSSDVPDVHFSDTNSLSFDGNAPVVKVATTGTLNESFTIAAWVKPNDPTAIIGIMGSRSPGDSSFDVKFENGNLIHADIGDGNNWLTTNADAAFNYSVGQWYHIAYVVTSTGYTIYANGTQVGSGSYAGTPLLYDADHNLVIGDTDGNEHWNGNIDDVRVYNRALALSEVSQLASGNDVPDSLVGYWKFDEGSGLSAIDASGNSYTGSLLPTAPTPSTDVPSQISFPDARSLSFDGTDDYVSILSSSSLKPVNGSLSAWVKVNAHKDWNPIVDNSANFEFGTNGSILYSDGAGTLHALIGNGSGYQDITAGGGVFTTGVWHSVVSTWDGTAFKLYLDGTQQASVAQTVTPTYTDNLQLGAGVGYPAYLDGLLDDVRVYSRALSASEVASLAQGERGNLGRGDITLGSALTVNGSLSNAATLDVSPSNYSLTLAGDLLNAGIFIPRDGTVILNGGDQTLAGSTHFWNLTKIVTSAHTLTLNTGDVFSVSGALVLQGTAGNLLSLVLSTDGTHPILALDSDGTQSLQYLSVLGIDATGDQKLNCIGTCTDAGHNVHWLFVPFSGAGTGTSNNPYLITSCPQLQEMKNDLAAHYALGNDIDCSATSGWNDGAGFVPVGNGDGPFTGSLDGRGHKITGLFIDIRDGSFVGLFGLTSGAPISNLGLENVDITGTSYAGGLAAEADGSTISNCYTTGTVLGNNSVGGLAGASYSGDVPGSITTSYSTATVIATAGWAGGLAGENRASTVARSYATGNVTESGSTPEGPFGGLVGENEDSASIINSYATGNVRTGGSNVGGLVGGNDSPATITNSYALGSASGSDNVGGLAGYNDGGTITNVFSVGTSTGPADVGGLIGTNGSTITHAAYDQLGSKQSVCVGTDTGTTDCTAVNTSGARDAVYFFGNSGNSPLDQWDFTTVWQRIPGDYPTLRAFAVASSSSSSAASSTAPVQSGGGGRGAGTGLFQALTLAGKPLPPPPSTVGTSSSAATQPLTLREKARAIVKTLLDFVRSRLQQRQNGHSSSIQEGPPAPSQLSSMTATITVPTNLRADARTSSYIRTVLRAGQQVTILRTVDGWAEVILPDGTQGFVIQSHLK